MVTKLTPDEYIALLVDRAAIAQASIDFAREQRELKPLPGWLSRHLPEHMIRDSDTGIVDMQAVAAVAESWLPTDQPPRRPTPRTYKPASHWQAALERIDADLARTTFTPHATDDPAAHGGIGIRQTPRQTARRHAAIDRSISKTARLMDERSRVAAKLAAATARETSK